MPSASTCHAFRERSPTNERHLPLAEAARFERAQPCGFGGLANRWFHHSPMLPELSIVKEQTWCAR